MSTYSGYSSSPSMPILPVIVFLAVAALVALSMLGGAGTVQLGTPRPTPDRSETGIDFDAAVREAKSVITGLKRGETGYLPKSTSGFIRVGYYRSGKLFVTPGSPSNPALDAMAERILAALVY